jgi:hypothetical protein
MDNLASVGLYAGTTGVIALAMVNPSGDKGLAQEWKALLLFGIIPAIIKQASMMAEARISTKVILISCVATVAIHLLLREMSEKYKIAFKNPSQAKSAEAIMAWGGITTVYAMTLAVSMFAFRTSKFNSSVVVKSAGNVPSAPGNFPKSAGA